MAWVAEWESRQTVSTPFRGVWRVREVPEDTMLSCREDRMISTTREGIKTLLRDSGNGHAVRFVR